MGNIFAPPIFSPSMKVSIAKIEAFTQMCSEQWKKKFGGMEVSDVKRLKELKDARKKINI